MMKRLVRDALVILLITCALGEVLARILTKTADNGMPVVGRIELLPYRPTREIVLAWEKKVANAKYMIHDPDLGWTLAKSATAPDAQTNAEAVRTRPDRVFGNAPTPGKRRILTVGDSFTHGDEVKNDETWQVALEAIDPNLEVINFGVPGYGTDQAFLRWRRDGRAFSPEIVILGIWTENLCRNVNVFRYYLVPTSAFHSKPRFAFESGTLQLVNSPTVDGDALATILAEPEKAPLIRHEYWYDPDEAGERAYRSIRAIRIVESIFELRKRKEIRNELYSGKRPQGIAITAEIAGQFAREAKEAQSKPIVLIIPLREMLLTPEVESGQFPLVRVLRERGLDVIDLGPPLAKKAKEQGIGALYLPSGHMSAAGNRAFAEAVASELAPRLDASRKGE